VAWHALFLLACAALAVRVSTPAVKWLAWVGHLSYMHRNPVITYGADIVLASLLLLLCLAPVGRALALHGPGRGLAAPPSAWGHACLRLAQIQVAVILFFAGAEKLRGTSWWEGWAVPFLGWVERARPWVVGLAATLFAGLGVLLGLYLFAFVMVAALTVFADASWLPRR
jgi:hypothetical protein